jgi:hypothetical protein
MWWCWQGASYRDKLVPLLECQGRTVMVPLLECQGRTVMVPLLECQGRTVMVPMAGLRIGEQLHWLDHTQKKTTSPG